MTNGKYIWPFVTQTTRRQLTKMHWPSQSFRSDDFHLATGNHGISSFLLEPTRYQGNHDRKQTKEQSRMDRNTAFLTIKYFIE